MPLETAPHATRRNTPPQAVEKGIIDAQLGQAMANPRKRPRAEPRPPKQKAPTRFVVDPSGAYEAKE